MDDKYDILSTQLKQKMREVFYQLERFVELSKTIAPILLKYPKAPIMLSVKQLEHIKDLINILRPLETISFRRRLCYS